MSVPVYRINAVLSTLLNPLPVGTNLALFHLLWTLLSGRFLASRGAVIPALALAGLPAAAVRRAWAALAHGRWQIATLVAAWERLVRAEGVWEPHRHDGYRPVAGDLTGFFRPRLQDCPTTHYCSTAEKALPAIPIALAVRVGSSVGQRVPVPILLLEADPADPREATLQRTLLQQIAALLAEDEAFIGDGGFHVAEVLAAGVPRFVVRGARNFTARRAEPPSYPGRGRPAEKGEIVRPLARKRKEKTIPATPPDATETWVEGERIVRADLWYDLVEREGKPGDPTFTVVVIRDPRYRQPLLVVTNLVTRPAAEEARGTTGASPERPRVTAQGVRRLYRDRWPVEQMPLAAKQMLGAERAYVFGPETRTRLPKLALVAGAILMYEAATQPAVRTGFWDRRPEATSGRLRRALWATNSEHWQATGARMRKKASVTAHLLTGVLGHRRCRREETPEQELRQAA